MANITLKDDKHITLDDKMLNNILGQNLYYKKDDYVEEKKEIEIINDKIGTNFPDINDTDQNLYNYDLCTNIIPQNT